MTEPKRPNEETAKILKEFFSDEFTKSLSDEEIRQTILMVITLISGYMNPGKTLTLEEMLTETMSFISRFMCIIFEAEKRGNQHSTTVEKLNNLFNL